MQKSKVFSWIGVGTATIGIAIIVAMAVGAGVGISAKADTDRISESMPISQQLSQEHDSCRQECQDTFLRNIGGQGSVASMTASPPPDIYNKAFNLRWRCLVQRCGQ